MNDYLTARVISIVSVALVLIATQSASAQRLEESVVGKWEFTIKREEREDIKFHIEFKANGEKLTGASTAPDGKVTELEEISIKGTTLTFQVTRTNGDRKIVTKVECKPRGDRLTGKVEAERNGEKYTVKLTAKRLTPEKKEAKKEEKKDGN